MESGALGLLRSHSRAKSRDPDSSRAKTNGSPTEPDDATKESKQQRSRSWFSPHRRKDSVASSILRSSKSLRRLSAVSSSTSSQPAISTPTTPSYSRGSYESDAAFHHRKLSSVGSGDAIRNGTLSEPAPTDPPSIPYPPHRPERPQEDLFEGTVLEKASQLGQQPAQQPSHRPSRSRSILRPFSPFPGPSIRDMRRLSQQSEHKLQTNIAAATATTNETNQLSSDADQAPEVADAGTNATSPKASVYSDLSAPAPIIPGRRPSCRATSNGSEPGVTRKASIASSFHFPIHRRPSQVTAEIESRKHARSSRWTLTENMAEMFKAQRVKTEKQPMTPSQIEAIWNGQDNSKTAAKQKKSKERRMKAASDSSASIMRPFGGPLTEQQNTVFREPFQWPDRAMSPVPMSRADIKMRALPFEITVPPPPSTILVSPEIIHGDVSPKSPSKVDRNPLERHQLPRLLLPEAEEAIAEDDDNDDASSTSSVPIVPPKNPARFVTRAPTMPLLPPIAEDFKSASDSKRASKASGHRRSRSWNHASEIKDEAIYFNSTPFTMTNPSFRHGPIVLSDAGSRDSVTTTTTEKAEEEHDVDWTAFQTAILGGARGDLDGLFPEEPVPADEEEGKIADDVTTWFEGFGFETHGELIDSEKTSPDKSDRSTQRDSAGSMTSAASTPSTVQTDADAELQTPVSAQHHQNVFDTIKQLRNRCESTYSASIYTTDSVDGPWGQTIADGETSHEEVGELAPTPVGSKQAMEHGLEAFLGFKVDDTY
ncbi:hypothetical protein TARUN_10458 [Trichoderma arundinaceum]|uniref:Uncharacterized protein n=1 Tax=Trichoderma arundinaceum TaxID=490622 RepID=A0A395N6R8_TRIAR|nr:hypothetical protein TARUN_10458 [Trichoderma arundinaceum]